MNKFSDGIEIIGEAIFATYGENTPESVKLALELMEWLPMDLFIDMAITMEKLSDKFNCNDGQLEDYDLDWWYFHKLNRRVQASIKALEKLVDTNEEEEE